MRNGFGHSFPGAGHQNILCSQAQRWGSGERMPTGSAPMGWGNIGFPSHGLTTSGRSQELCRVGMGHCWFRLGGENISKTSLLSRVSEAVISGWSHRGAKKVPPGLWESLSSQLSVIVFIGMLTVKSTSIRYWWICRSEFMYWCRSGKNNCAIAHPRDEQWDCLPNQSDFKFVLAGSGCRPLMMSAFVRLPIGFWANFVPAHFSYSKSRLWWIWCILLHVVIFDSSF